MTHDDKPGVLFSYKGHELLVDEGHAIVFGSLGFLLGSTDEISKPLLNEPHYAVGAFVVFWLLGRGHARLRGE